MKVTFQGKPLTLKGTQVKVGDMVPDFTVVDNDLKPLNLSDTKGKRVFLTVPSLDTPVCDMEVRKFNQEATKLDENVTIYTVSMDLPFAQGRWCGGAGIDRVKTVSDYKDREFGNNYGVYINELGLLSRAVFVVDENNKVVYVEYLEEITNEPNYEKALESIK
ncbi:thiol peroxidase [Terrisporobacter petrolearius]|nr:thiol peroxidase [Terrisporobacter petrolearius]MCC3864392.1 thiol peroxidase [Terrisporobacter petrolearius]